MAKSVLSAEHFHDKAAALAFIDARTWSNGPACPRCGERNRIGRLNGKTTKLGMCKCYACRIMQGHQIVAIKVDPDEFIQFCRTRGRACDNDNMRIFAENLPDGN